VPGIAAQRGLGTVAVMLDPDLGDPQAGLQHPVEGDAARRLSMPRPACLEGEFVLPTVRRHTWYRAARLVQVRAEREFGAAKPGRPADRAMLDPDAETMRTWRMAFTSVAVRQMIATLGSVTAVSDKGVIKEVDRLLKGYASHWGVSERTTYRHWEAVRDLGLVRQVRHSAPDQPTIYVLTFPPARIPEDMPITAAGHGRTVDLDALVTSWDQAAAEHLAELDEVELAAYGSSATRERDKQTEPDPEEKPFALSSYICQAWPYYARGLHPSGSTGRFCRPDRPVRARTRGGISTEERAQALKILQRCRSRWSAQLAKAAMPDAADLAELTGMVAVSRRYVTEGELIELLTVQVATARDLVKLLRHRLQQLLNRSRRQAPTEIDEDGAVYQAKAAQRAQDARELHDQTADRRAEARAAMEAARQRKAAAAAEAERFKDEQRAAKRAELGLRSLDTVTVAPLWPSVDDADLFDAGRTDARSLQRLTTSELAQLRWAQRKANEGRRPKPRPLDVDADPHDVLGSLASWNHPSDRR
jgi:hypothetical protein